METTFLIEYVTYVPKYKYIHYYPFCELYIIINHHNMHIKCNTFYEEKETRSMCFINDMYVEKLKSDVV